MIKINLLRLGYFKLEPLYNMFNYETTGNVFIIYYF